MSTKGCQIFSFTVIGYLYNASINIHYYHYSVLVSQSYYVRISYDHLTVYNQLKWLHPVSPLISVFLPPSQLSLCACVVHSL